MVKKINVMDAKWDHLIILDACRYDFFSKVYADYIDGEIEKVLSIGSSTLEWCKKTFEKVYDDVVYVSANPFINSRAEIKGFRPADHFNKIIDVWDSGWNEGLGTVHPKEVNQVVLNSISRFPNKRLIIHYLQPHAPYIGYSQTFGFPRPEIEHSQPLVGIQSVKNKGFFEEILETSLSLIFKPIMLLRGSLGGKLLWEVRELLNLPPISPMDYVRREFGDGGLQKAYLHNLELVLEHVAELVKYLSGVIIITADHGEYLGEGGKYSHFNGCKDRILLEVPWLVIKKTCAETINDSGKPQMDSDIEQKKENEEIIKNKLRKLGYIQ